MVLTSDEVGSNVDNDGSGLDPGSLDKVGNSDGSDDDVGLADLHSDISTILVRRHTTAHDALEVLGAAVALSDGRILPPQQRADGASNDVTASEDDGMLAGDADSSGLEEEHNSGGGAGRVELLPGAGREKSNVVGVETVNVLLWRDGLGDAPLSLPSNVVAEGELHEDSVDGGVVVQLLDLAHDLVFSHAVLLAAENDESALDARLGARLELHLDIRRRVGTGTLLDDRDVGLEAGELACTRA
jgi:hypothetical protein